jgi:hypothetical protein
VAAAALRRQKGALRIRKELAGTLTWKMMLSTQHRRKPSLACTYALPFSCLDAFCILLLAALVIDLCCVPCVLTTWSHQLGHAMDFNSVILYFPCAVCYACLAAQLGCLGKSVAATVAGFLIILQLYLIKTQARPTPPAFNKIALLSHIACKSGEMENRRRGGPR